MIRIPLRWVFIVALASSLGAGPVFAHERGRMPPEVRRAAMARQQNRAAGAEAAQRRAAAEVHPAAGTPPEAMAPAGEANPPRPLQRPGRLTPDERKALRRQIDDASHDVYQNPNRTRPGP